MNNMIRLMLFLLPCIILMANDSKLIEFSLEDQFARTHRKTEYSGKVVVMVASDKEGSVYSKEWGRAIGDSMSHDISSGSLLIIPVADLASVPSFIRGLVKMMMPDNPEAWVLLDWEGLFTKAYGLTPDATNILVFDPLNRLVHQQHVHHLESGKLENILEILKSNLTSNIIP